MRFLASISVLICFSISHAFTCTVDFEYLMGPKRASERLRINSMKVSYSIPIPDTTCVKILKLIKTKEELVESNDCLNGLGHLAIIQLAWEMQAEKVQVNKVILGCNEFKTGAFFIGKKGYEISFPKIIRDELLRIQKESNLLHEKVINSNYF